MKVLGDYVDLENNRILNGAVDRNFIDCVESGTGGKNPYFGRVYTFKGICGSRNDVCISVVYKGDEHKNNGQNILSLIPLETHLNDEQVWKAI